MKKILLFLCLFGILTGQTFAKTFLNQDYIGKWDKTPICSNPMILEKDRYTIDPDYGYAKILKIEIADSGGLVVYGREAFSDEGYITYSPGYIKLNIHDDALVFSGRFHEQMYDDKYVRCKDDKEGVWTGQIYTIGN